MNITYTKQGDYLLPDLYLKQTRKAKLGRYARMKLKFLREESRTLYHTLLATNEFTNYLEETEAKAKDMEIILINHIIKKLDVNEELKQKDQMKWVQMMNNISNIAFENVCGKIIYSFR